MGNRLTPVFPQCVKLTTEELIKESKVGFPRWYSGKKSASNAGDARDAGSIPGLGRSPGVKNGNPLQYSRLENSMDRGAWPLSMGSQSMRSRVRDFILEESRFCFHPLQLTFPV